MVRTNDPSYPALVRYVVWDNRRVGEWRLRTVFDGNLNYLGGMTI